MGRRSIRILAFIAGALLALAPRASAQNIMQVLPEVCAPLSIFQVAPASPTALVDVSNRPKLPEISPNTNMPRFDSAREGGNVGPVDLAIESSQFIEPRYIENSQHPDDMGLWEGLGAYYRPRLRGLAEDYKNFYWSENLLYLGGAIAIAAPLANTNADQTVRTWYQRGAGNGRFVGLDHTADVFNGIGNWEAAVPVLLACSLVGYAWDDNAAAAAVGEFGNRSVRALAVGAPSVIALQFGLGAGGPNDPPDSRWRPGQSDHGVSGAAFVGAVPFLTAASMTDSAALKTLFVVGSLGPSWASIHNDDHYLSQVLLGWSIAYLSVHSVNLTESVSHFRLVPCEIPKGVGIGVQVEY